MPHDAPPPPTASKTRDLALLGSRDKANPGNLIQLRATVNALRGQLDTARRRNGEDAHQVGTTALTLYMAFADQLYGYVSFVEFAHQELGLVRSTLYRYLRVAKYATASQAQWGIDTCLAAGNLVELFRDQPRLRKRFALGSAPETISDLAHLALPTEGKSTIRLAGANVRHDDVLAVLASLAPDSAGPGKLSRTLHRLNEKLRLAVADDPSLRGVEARYISRQGKPVLKLLVPAGADFADVAARIGEIVAES